MVQCSETCGWLTGTVAAFAFGSFGVPIKAVSDLNVDPMVLQSYKSLMCFTTCWLAIPMGEELRFSPWGIVSGIFWVPAATCGIYGIRNAGLAISVGTWSALIVISSFCWGIFVFEEKVKSTQGALSGATTLIIGLVGMSCYSSPAKGKNKKELKLKNVPLQEEAIAAGGRENDHTIELAVRERSNSTNKIGKRKLSNSISRQEFISSEESELLVEDTNGENVVEESPEKIVICNGLISLTRYQLGILGAIINGTWGSTNMIPMHYARAQGFYGTGYLISYGVGSMIVTIGMWIIRYLYYVFLKGNFKEGYAEMPSFHFRKMWMPGLISGSLYSIGNFCSILTVVALGQGIGYSFTQTAMLISGLWGIFYFHEVQGRERIAKWLCSSMITIVGILWLSYEHDGTPSH